MVADTIFVPISSCLLSENMVVVYCSLFLVEKKKLNPLPRPPGPPFIQPSSSKKPKKSNLAVEIQTDGATGITPELMLRSGCSFLLLWHNRTSNTIGHWPSDQCQHLGMAAYRVRVYPALYIVLFLFAVCCINWCSACLYWRKKLTILFYYILPPPHCPPPSALNLVSVRYYPPSFHNI